MTPLDLPALRAILPSNRLIAERRDDGTARIYSPSLGVMREIVDFAETSTEFADLIVALPRLIAELEAARECVSALRAEVYGWKFGGGPELEDLEAPLSTYDAATNGGG